MNYSQATDQLIAKKSFSAFGVLLLSRHAFFVLSSELKFEIIAIAVNDSTLKHSIKDFFLLIFTLPPHKIIYLETVIIKLFGKPQLTWNQNYQMIGLGFRRVCLVQDIFPSAGLNNTTLYQSPQKIYIAFAIHFHTRDRLSQ